MSMAIAISAIIAEIMTRSSRGPSPLAELVCSPGTSLVSRAIITRRTLLAVQERHRRRSQVTNLRCSSGGEVPEPLFVNRMVPVGEDGPNRSDQSEGLIERNMVIRLRDLDHRGVPARQLLHMVLYLRGDQIAELAVH